MNNRARRVFSFDPALIEGACYGFWSWAAHQLGAAKTVGIEGRQESANRGDKLLAPYKHAYLIGNTFDIMPKLADEGQNFDMILNLCFNYHIYDHYGMLKLMDALKPKVIVIDSEIDDSDEPVVRTRKEKTWEPNNAIAEVEGHEFSAVGNASPATLKLLAECFNQNFQGCDWSNLGNTEDCDNYVNRQQFTCLLSKDSNA